MLGLDAAGKTTILYQLKLGDVVTSIPTIGFNVETIQTKGLTMIVWDIGGQDRIRVLWEHYFENSDALIFVVDASDSDRFDEARRELHAIVSNSKMHGIKCVLVFANKMDLPTALDLPTLEKRLGLSELRAPYHLQACSAVARSGIEEGIERLSHTLSP